MDMGIARAIRELQSVYYEETLNKPTIEQLIKTNARDFTMPTHKLTMVSASGLCQLCEKPEGITRTYIFNYKFYNGEDKRGFIVCAKDECNFYIKTYIKFLYNNVYITKQWKELVYKRANNIFVSVKRTNGVVENDWLLCEDNIKTISIYDTVTILILCCKKLNLNISSDIFEYIYKVLIKLYNDDIHLLFDNVINIEDKLSTKASIRCFKGNMSKTMPIELLGLSYP